MGLLKGEMGFRGVVVTDAVKMLGLCTLFGSLQEVYIAALKAGNDAILGVDADYIDVIEAAVERGEISEERINDACQRVLDMKEKLGLFDEPTYHNTDDIAALNATTAQLNKQIADKAITLDIDRAGLFPLEEKIKRVHIITICSDPTFETQIRDGLAAAFEKRGVCAGVSANLYSYEEIEKIAEENDLIIYACNRVRKHCYFDVDNRESFNFILHAGAEKSLGVSFGDPYVAFDKFSCLDTFINAYTMAPEAQEAVADAILGNIPFQKSASFEIIPKEFQEYEQ
jgi:beta-N-acetylhexosaminidase